MDPIVALEAYRSRVEASMSGVEIKDRVYSRGSITVYQLLISNQIMVNTRLILLREGRLPVQMDYLVPRGVYPEVIKAIEASIGSIEPL